MNAVRIANFGSVDLMKRITYISRPCQAMSDSDVQAISTYCYEKNREQQVTGVLLFFCGLFFQTIEGSEEKINLLFAKIRQDKRHRDVLCLKMESGNIVRMFPDWSMKYINLDTGVEDLNRPVRVLLQSIIESHQIIGRYTQPAVLHIINQGLNPLNIPPRKVERVILFADLVNFSLASEILEVEETADMLNRFLEITSKIISDLGGEVTKFIGDCVMAYFSPEQADNALRACLLIIQALRQQREKAGASSPMRFLRCGFGLAQGMVIEGNMGSQVKTDYTIIGDAVNTAARLESMTREVGKPIVLCEKIRQSFGEDWKLVSVGRLQLKGKEKAIEVFYPQHELIDDFAEAINPRISQIIAD
ncbi:MAG: family 3 adenylate cyclase [Candidatus Riflebacteria bacterium HGW-Riflebacteria-2]|jgi:class 3 adenylate cyclase|nr:MAG: family 3 adenylate cyclase [Candidatus Riflebacteria bacterium HGW-Riflebacteria-2]